MILSSLLFFQVLQCDSASLSSWLSVQFYLFFMILKVSVQNFLDSSWFLFIWFFSWSWIYFFMYSILQKVSRLSKMAYYKYILFFYLFYCLHACLSFSDLLISVLLLSILSSSLGLGVSRRTCLFHFILLLYSNKNLYPLIHFLWYLAKFQRG